jgi:hypothetical protein
MPQRMLRNTTTKLSLQGNLAGKIAGSASETSSNARARFWFQLEEIMTGTILMNIS